MQKPCHLRLVRICNIHGFSTIYHGVCIACNPKYTTERVQATRSLSFTLRSLVKLMKVSISRIIQNVKY